MREHERKKKCRKEGTVEELQKSGLGPRGCNGGYEMLTQIFCCFRD